MVRYFCDACKEEITEHRIVVQILKPRAEEPLQRDYHEMCFEEVEPKLKGVVI